MPATTFLNPADYRVRTSNVELNSYLDMLISETGLDWRVFEIIDKRRHRFFPWRVEIEASYMLFVHVGGAQFQVINFYTERGSSINQEVSATTIVNYIMGILSGIQEAKRQLGVVDGLKGISMQHPLPKIMDYVRQGGNGGLRL